MDMLDPALDSSQDKDVDSSPVEMVVPDKSEVLTSRDLTIVEEDGSLGSAEEACVGVDETSGGEGTTLVDAASGVQYQFRTDGNQGGPLTYRVVHVGSGDGSTSPTVTSAEALPQIAAASPGFSAAQVITSPLNGQFYVIGSQDMFAAAANTRALAPRSGQVMEPGRVGSTVPPHLPQRDERRRATHNEVERRRRDKINNWIVKLSKIIPDCTQDHSKQGQVSKGGILAKACEYIAELRGNNQHLSETLKERERSQMEADVLRQQVEELRAENAMLRSRLQQHGIHVTEVNPLSNT